VPSKVLRRCVYQKGPSLSEWFRRTTLGPVNIKSHYLENFFFEMMRREEQGDQGKAPRLPMKVNKECDEERGGEGSIPTRCTDT